MANVSKPVVRRARALQPASMFYLHRPGESAPDHFYPAKVKQDACSRPIRSRDLHQIEFAPLKKTERFMVVDIGWSTNPDSWQQMRDQSPRTRKQEDGIFVAALDALGLPESLIALPPGRAVSGEYVGVDPIYDRRDVYKEIAKHNRKQLALHDSGRWLEGRQWYAAIELGQPIETGYRSIEIEPGKIGVESATIDRVVRLVIPTEAELKEYAIDWSAAKTGKVGAA